jgi:hypothetical protein
MRFRTLLLVVVGIGGCATTGPARPPRSTLTSGEVPLLAKSKEKDDGGFRRVWRSPELRTWGFIKWDVDQSSAAAEAPRDLLQAAREEVGRLNQDVSPGPDLRLAVNVYRFRRGGLFRKSAASCELVVRDDRGRLMWAANGQVDANPAVERSLADTEAVLIARELVRKIRVDLKPQTETGRRPGGPPPIIDL